MGKYIKKNAAVDTIENVWLIKDSSGNYHERVQGNMINLVNNADVVLVYQPGGGGGPHWGVVYTYTVDFNTNQSISVYHDGSTVTLTGHPATCTSQSNISNVFYVEYSQNNPDLVQYDDYNNYYRTMFNSRSEILTNVQVVQFQKGCTALTSVFPGVTYNGTTVTYNPVELKPYTVELYGDGELIDSWTDCDTYDWTYYNDSSTNLGTADYAVYDWNEKYNTNYTYINSIQYSVLTSGDSDWTDLGYYTPFPDNVNVKRVRITLA